MSRLAATLPGYASVARASDVLHLAPRSVRDLIYDGRIPSLRIGRLHYIKASDLEVERRRRLGLPPRKPRARVASSAPPRTKRPAEPHTYSLDTALRRQRAVERAQLVSRWARRHAGFETHVPAVVLGVTSPLECAVCGRIVRKGRIVELAAENGEPAARLCVTCGRRALLQWADRRRLEAAAARQLSHSLGDATAESAPDAPDVHAA